MSVLKALAAIFFPFRKPASVQSTPYEEVRIMKASKLRRSRRRHLGSAPKCNAPWKAIGFLHGDKRKGAV